MLEPCPHIPKAEINDRAHSYTTDKRGCSIIIWVWKSCCWVTGDHRSGRDFLSLIITETCWAAGTKHLKSRYIDGALDRSESGAKWQIKSPFPCESLLILLSASSLYFPSWSFVPRFNKLPFSLVVPQLSFISLFAFISLPIFSVF